MTDLRELYQEFIVENAKSPKNFGPLPSATHHADGTNPLCGDKVTLHLELDGDKIKDARFEGCGCAISTASASILTESVKGKTPCEAETLFDEFQQSLTNDAHQPNLDLLGNIQVLLGVKEYPMRVKCATLVWHTMRAALKNSAAPVTTE